MERLQIVYDGIDLRSSNQELLILLVRFVNQGREDITTAHYDAGRPVGLDFSNGRIVRAELLDASNSYLQKAITVSQPSANSVRLPAVIIEAGESFSLKLLVLAERGVDLRASVVGKVAGIRQLSLASVPSQGADSLWRRAFAGGVGVQLVRMPAYLVLTFLVLVIPAFVAGGIVKSCV